MPQPTGSDLHIDTYLSNVGVAYMNEPGAYIADRVFPVVPVDKQSDLYPVYAKDFWFRDEAQKRAPLTEGEGGGYELEDPGTYYCHEWSWFVDTPEEDLWNADDVFNLEDDALSYTVEKLRLKRERLWAENYFAAGVWGTEVVGGPDFVQWDDDDANPIVDVGDWKEQILRQTGIKANTLVVPYNIHQFVKNNAEVLDRFKYTQAGIITEQILARVFEVENYLVGYAVHAPHAEGAEGDLEYILNDESVLLVYAPPRPSRRRPSGGYTFRWNRPSYRGQAGSRLAMTVRKYDLGRKRGQRIQGSIYEDLKLVASDVGLFATCVVAEES
jgi:hypothetical protein